MYNLKFIRQFQSQFNRYPSKEECAIHNIMRQPKIINDLHSTIYCDIIWAICSDCLDAMALWYHHEDGFESATKEEEHAYIYELNQFIKKGVIK